MKCSYKLNDNALRVILRELSETLEIGMKSRRKRDKDDVIMMVLCVINTIRHLINISFEDDEEGSDEK